MGSSLMAAMLSCAAVRPGDSIAGRYKLIDRLGEGGMGVVWRGEQTALGRAVAIKVIHHDVANDEMRERFQREAELAARVHHRNVIDIVEYGATDEGDQYLVMPLLRGETMATRLARMPRPSAGEVLTWMRGVLGGLAAIHDEGIVHRDLKPANVFLAEDADGVLPKLLDFGISRSARSADASLTRLGTAIGTPQYMAPEQFESSRDLDSRADIYAAGSVLYEALTGKPPFDGADAFAIYRSILSSEPAPLTQKRPDLPDDLALIVQKALARDPAARFSSAREMREAIAAVGLGGTVLETPAPSGSIGLAATKSMETVHPLTKAKPTSERTKDEGYKRTAAMDVSGEVRRASGSIEQEKRSILPWILGGVGLLAVIGVVGFFVMPKDDPPPIERDPDVAVEPAAAMGHRVAGPDDLHTLALAWAHLPRELRAIDVRIAPASGSWAMIAAPEAERVSELAAALESESADVEWTGEGYTPALYAANVRVNVHAEPSRESLTRRVLLQGALVVALEGTIDGQVSGGTDEGAVTYFVAAPNSAGWALSRFLTAETACMPVVERLAHDVEVSPDVLAGDTLAVRTELSLAPGETERVYVLVARDRETVRSYVGVYAAGPECQLGEQRGLHRFDGVIDEVFFTETARAGGESLVLVSTHPSATPPPDGMLDWNAYRVGDLAPVWTDRVPTAPYLRTRQQGAVSGSRDRILRTQREHFILAVRRPREERVLYRWVDETIVPEQAAEAPTGGATDEEAPNEEPPNEEPAPEPPASEVAPNPFE
jgi:serine/threonine protein kinase